MILMMSANGQHFINELFYYYYCCCCTAFTAGDGVKTPAVCNLCTKVTLSESQLFSNFQKLSSSSDILDNLHCTCQEILLSLISNFLSTIIESFHPLPVKMLKTVHLLHFHIRCQR